MTACKFYIRFQEDMPATEVQAAALYGFRARGVETVPFYGFGDVDTLDDLGPDVGVAGYLGDVWAGLDKLGIPRPPSLDYPDELRGFLGRNIERMSLRDARKVAHRGVFVKPVVQKLFTGFVCTGSVQDQIRLGPYDEGQECWVSEPVDFRAEFRCFVLHDEILDLRRYKGDWALAPDRATVEWAVMRMHPRLRRDRPRAHPAGRGQ